MLANRHQAPTHCGLEFGFGELEPGLDEGVLDPNPELPPNEEPEEPKPALEPEPELEPNPEADPDPNPAAEAEPAPPSSAPFAFNCSIRGS